MTDPRTRQQLQDLQTRLDKLERKLAPSTAIGQGVNTLYGALSIRTTQLGFAAETTNTYNTTTGYPWKRLELDISTPEFDDPDIQPTGTHAFTIDDNRTLPTGTLCWIEPDPTSTGYVIVSTGTNKLLIGKLDGTMNYAGSATMSVWAWNGSADADTTVNVTVYDWLLKSGQSIASGTQVVAAYVGGRWRVIGAACE